ncbi:DUF2938 domain-containing protein [Aliidiomarina minuta]|uniref:DUF2938 domain-containing protein n=1 Tax=Aliidiomarina minuta TaxID=880057 RepID=A0A432W6C1_9GAMM|nr:DUF2938 domain-containing protein [Aliidiomarina minuta]RUO25529.1 DUF2938 domain-containing protein [Aliidiomarina minuta]
MNNLLIIVFIGIGATTLMDLWGILRQPLFGIPKASYGMLGRWTGHMAQGKFRHNSIGSAAPVKGEQGLGWLIHYLTGIAFAALLIAIWGESWLQAPRIGPAMIIGIGSIAAPFLIMQPAMGAGIAASRTPSPNAARLQSLITHAVFGLGLYASAMLVQFFNAV